MEFAPFCRIAAGVALVSTSTLFGQSLTLETADRRPEPIVAPAAPEEAQQAIKRFGVPAGFGVKLWAAEPMLANPVAFEFDERGRLFVSETHRYRTSVLDIRGYMGMVELDLAARTLEDRVAMVQKVFGEEGARQLSIEGEVVRLVEDRDGDGTADTSSVFAEGFNSQLDGIASGVLPRRGKVWFTNIPSLWLLEADATGTKAEKRTELLRGFGVRFNYTGHDFHGLAFGPDGKLYYSIGDRGTHVRGKEGQLVHVPDEGAVFRSNPDGTEFELVARGLRNPQELAFDEFGNLFTGDNDSDNGDLERLVYLVEGGDSGWRVGYQHAPLGKAGPWLRESLWKPRFPGQPAYLLPPICNIEDGPSGVTYYPGTGLTSDYKGHLFICHFKGSIARSGIQSYTVKPDGAGFAIVSSSVFMSGILATDATFGPDGKFYVADWVEGWPKSTKGRVYSVSPLNRTEAEKQLSEEVKGRLAEGFSRTDENELLGLLGHADQRIRLEAQFEFAERGERCLPALQGLAMDSSSGRLARLHALWGMAQIARRGGDITEILLNTLKDTDPEVRAQSAKLLGDLRVADAVNPLLGALNDSTARTRFFAAQSLGKLKVARATAPLIELLRRNADQDVYLRHAAVYALSQLADTAVLRGFEKDASASVRLAVLLVYRATQNAAIATFLEDPDPYIVREAALAINDAPVEKAWPALAAKLATVPTTDEALSLRAINANFRVGQAEQAQALTHYVARVDVPEALRSEALVQLGLWANVPARDRLVGVYRPLPPRDASVAAQALQGVTESILTNAPVAVQLSCLSALQQLKATSAADLIIALVKNESAAGEVRARALEVVDAFEDPRILELITAATETPVTELRLASLQILARRAPQAALPVISRLAETGSEQEQQAAYLALGRLNLPETPGALVAALDRLSAGKVAVGAQFELMDAVEKSTDPKVQERWQLVRDGWTKGTDLLAPYRGSLSGGDVRRGSRLFANHPVLACIRCHKVDGTGGEAGPDLTLLGAQKTPEYILESVIKPSARIAEGFNVVSVQLKNGGFEAGTVVRETPEQLVIKRTDGSELTIPVADIKERQSAPSSMPEIYAQVLSRSELRDLMAYLQNLTEAHPAMGQSARATGTATKPPSGSGHD